MFRSRGRLEREGGVCDLEVIVVLAVGEGVRGKREGAEGEGGGCLEIWRSD